MASGVSLTLPARRRLIRAVRPMRRVLSICAVIAVVLSLFAALQWRKCNALALLDGCGEIDDWQFFGHALARDTAVPRWLPGVWPRSLAINQIPPDTTRYASAVKTLPGLDIIMVFVYEPMSIDIFTALGAVRGAKILDLTSTSVSDSALEKFTQFGTVEELLLNHSTITDASVTHILRFQRVRTLSIYTNNLSDSSVLQFGQLPELRILDLDERLGAQTVATLHARRPDLELNQ